MNAPYALIPVTLLVLLAYFFSYILEKWKIIRKESHLYTWNLILLITFIISGLLGLLAVVKVNYKLVIPHYEDILRLHIHIGIGMVMVAFIHFFRHIRYYFSPPRSRVSQKIPGEDQANKPEKTAKNVFILLFLLGFISFTAQLVLIREFVSVFTGNELVIGFFLSLWLIITGAGALSANKSDPDRFSYIRLKFLILFMAFLPLLTIFMIYWFKSNLFPPGTAPGPLEILAGIALLLFPFCFLSGYLFVILTGAASGIQKKNLISRSYIIETLGSLAGGICFSFLLVFILRSIEVLAVLLAVTGLSLSFQAIKKQNAWSLHILTMLTLLLLVAVFTFKLDTKLKSLFFLNQEIIYNKSDFTGNLVVTTQEGQLNFYTNNNLEFYTSNIIDTEESAHYAMLQSENPHKVLIVSGDALAVAREVMKYGVDSIDVIMFSKQYYILTEKFTDQYLPGEKMRTFAGDPIRLLQKKIKGNYDVILLNVPPPSTLKDNRLFTKEFLIMLKTHCIPKTIISLQLPSTSNYAGPEAIGLNSIIYNTLRLVFNEVLFIPGEKNFYLASDSKLKPAFTEEITKKGIQNEYVNGDYLNDKLMKERSNTLISALDGDATVNRLLNPDAFRLHLREWLRMHGTIYWIFVAIPFLLLLFIMVRQTPVRTGLVISGFTATALQILLVIGFQLFFGNIFYQVSLFFMVFLAGLALGTHFGQKHDTGINQFNRWQLGLAGLSLLCILLFLIILKYPGFKNFSFLFHLINGLAAFCLGQIFSHAAKLEKQDIIAKTSMNYSADLWGSALGTYLTTIFLIPVLGIITSGLLIGTASVAGFLYVFIRRKGYL